MFSTKSSKQDFLLQIHHRFWMTKFSMFFPARNTWLFLLYSLFLLYKDAVTQYRQQRASPRHDTFGFDFKFYGAEHGIRSSPSDSPPGMNHHRNRVVRCEKFDLPDALTAMEQSTRRAAKVKKLRNAIVYRPRSPVNIGRWILTSFECAWLGYQNRIYNYIIFYETNFKMWSFLQYFTPWAVVKRIRKTWEIALTEDA